MDIDIDIDSKIKQYETLIYVMETSHKLDLVLEYREKLKELKIIQQCGKR